MTTADSVILFGKGGKIYVWQVFNSICFALRRYWQLVLVVLSAVFILRILFCMKSSVGFLFTLNDDEHTIIRHKLFAEILANNSHQNVLRLFLLVNRLTFYLNGSLPEVRKSQMIECCYSYLKPKSKPKIVNF